MKKILTITVILVMAFVISASIAGTNGNTCVVDAQCGMGRCIKSFGGLGTCAGDVNYMPPTQIVWKK